MRKVGIIVQFLMEAELILLQIYISRSALNYNWY